MPVVSVIQKIVAVQYDGTNPAEVVTMLNNHPQIASGGPVAYSTLTEAGGVLTIRATGDYGYGTEHSDYEVPEQAYVVTNTNGSGLRGILSATDFSAQWTVAGS